MIWCLQLFRWEKRNVSSLLRILANQGHQRRTVEKFLDFLDIPQRFKPARIKSHWRTNFENGGLRCTLQIILRSWLGYYLCLQLRTWWSGRYLQPLGLPRQGLCGMVAGTYAAVADGCRTQTALKGDYWTNSIHFPQCFTLLQKSAGRMKEQTTDVWAHSSERQLTSDSCSSVPVFSALSYPTAETSPMRRCLREKQWWAQFLSRKRRTKLGIISQRHWHSRILLSAWCCQSGILVHSLDCSQLFLIRHQFTLKSRTCPH